MREFWVQIGSSPIVYRYIDWSITVPLQMVEFYLILSAVQPNISGSMFWRLLVGTVVMLAAGCCGEAGFVNPWLGFVVGMAGWRLLVGTVVMLAAGSVAAAGDKVNVHVKTSFSTMRFIVTVGWSIYPLGYFFGYLMGGVDDDSPAPVGPVDPYNCAVGQYFAWDQAKQSWCCRIHHICGQPTQPPAPADPYNCEDGFANWQAGWSVPKKQWCCQVHGKGCPNQGGGCMTSSEPYDCNAGFANWMAGWSVPKKSWCCANKGKGRPPAVGGCA